MALKLRSIPSTAVDEALRPLYVEKDGKFALAVDGSKILRRAENRTAERTQARRRPRKADQGLEDVSARRRRKSQELVEAQEAEGPDRSRAQGRMGQAPRPDERQARQRPQAKGRNHRPDAQASQGRTGRRQGHAAIAAARACPICCCRIVQRFTKVDEDFNVVVVDAKGDPRVNGKGEPLTIADLIEEMKANEIYGRAFEGSGQSGSGTRPNNGLAGDPSAVSPRPISTTGRSEPHSSTSTATTPISRCLRNKSRAAFQPNP
jgi:hypothetical protein